MTVDGPLMAR